MDKIKIMVNGVPGNVASKVIRHVLNDNRFELVPYSLTGPEITAHEYVLDGTTVYLLRPREREDMIQEIKDMEGPFICVDFTHPSAFNANVEFYCEWHLPFIMGTTGGDPDLLKKAVAASNIPAIIAPNMAKQIVGFQAMMEYAAVNFPGLFKNYSLKVQESHQKGKADTSGTAKAMVEYFNTLGCKFSEEQIIKERDPEKQKNELGIPEAYLKGHAWHTYTLTSPDKTVQFAFTHNINGRDIYAYGVLDAVMYLNEKIKSRAKGQIFSMIDVLKKN